MYNNSSIESCLLRNSVSMSASTMQITHSTPNFWNEDQAGRCCETGSSMCEEKFINRWWWFRGVVIQASKRKRNQNPNPNPRSLRWRRGRLRGQHFVKGPMALLLDHFGTEGVSRSDHTKSFRLVLALKLMGIMMSRNRYWVTTLHTLAAGDAGGWCQKWPVWLVPQCPWSLGHNWLKS